MVGMSRFATEHWDRNALYRSIVKKQETKWGVKFGGKFLQLAHGWQFGTRKPIIKFGEYVNRPFLAEPSPLNCPPKQFRLYIFKFNACHKATILLCKIKYYLSIFKIIDSITSNLGLFLTLDNLNQL